LSQLGRFRRLLGMRHSDDRRRQERVDARMGLKVLIIDDSRTVVAALSHMLRQSGYLPVGAGNGEKGLELAESECPDLIFLDIVLPGLNGFAALRRLRKNPRTAKIPVIMISGNPQAAEQFYLERIGADDFMKKPFGRGEVFSRIEKLVKSGGLPARKASASMEPLPSNEPDSRDLRISDVMKGEGVSEMSAMGPDSTTAPVDDTSEVLQSKASDSTLEPPPSTPSEAVSESASEEGGERAADPARASEQGASVYEGIDEGSDDSHPVPPESDSEPSSEAADGDGPNDRDKSASP